MARSWWWGGSLEARSFTDAQRHALKAADAMLRASHSRSFEEDYEPLSPLGSGGAATVARCVHRGSKKVVAVKRVPLSSSPPSSSPSATTTTRREALVELASLILLQGAPHAIELLDAVEETGKRRSPSDKDPPPPPCVYLVTRLCSGGELFDAVASRERYCEREAAAFVRALASFLKAAHERGVVHRDLKPENVTLLREGGAAGDEGDEAASVWPSPVGRSVPPTSTPGQAARRGGEGSPALPSRLCREASDVAAILSCSSRSAPSPRAASTAAAAPRRPSRASFAGGADRDRRRGEKASRDDERRRTTWAGGAASEEKTSPPSLDVVLRGRRRCTCLEREGVRVIDLGCAAFFDPESLRRPSSGDKKKSRRRRRDEPLVGTPYYAAPETLPRAFDDGESDDSSPLFRRDPASDVWSLGVISFVLCCGRPPFGGRDDAEVVRKVGAWKRSSSPPDALFRGSEWARVSEPAKRVIGSMLERDPRRRATAADVLGCEWVNPSPSPSPSSPPPSDAADDDDAAALRARIRAFAAESKLHALAAVALARTVSGAEGAARLRELLLRDGEEEGDESEGDDEESDDVAPRRRSGGASVVPLPAADGEAGLEAEKSKSASGGRLGGLLRRTLTLGTSGAASALAAAEAEASNLPRGCEACEACGGIVIGKEERPDAFLEGLLERARPPPGPVRSQSSVGPERAAELAFAALDADGDGWICADDLVRASDAGDEGGGGEEEATKVARALTMSREDALACIAEANKGHGGLEGDGIDLEAFKRAIWSSSSGK